jgi:hypothetical protein
MAFVFSSTLILNEPLGISEIAALILIVIALTIALFAGRKT